MKDIFKEIKSPDMGENQRDWLVELLNEDCQYRWTELTPMGRKINIVCGHPMPCPKHSNVDEWRKNIARAIREQIEARLPEEKAIHKDDYKILSQKYNKGFNEALTQVKQRLWG